MQAARSSARSVCSLGTGAITNWPEFEAWARTAEGAEVERQLDEALEEARNGAENPFARAWAPIAALVHAIGAVVATVPVEVRRLLNGAVRAASRALREGSGSLDARANARAELERTVESVRDAIRAARAGFVDADEEHLRQWARALGVEVEHSTGCPGMLVPGVGLFIDEHLPREQRHTTIASLLRRCGREAWTPGAEAA